MREYTGADQVVVSEDDNVVQALLENARRAPDRAALAVREGDAVVDITTAEFVRRVRSLAAGLIALGVEPGDRVCIFMRTRVEFTLLDYAIWCAGATTVTIYETSSADQVEWIVGDSGAVAIICGNADLRARFDSVADRVPDCGHVLVADDADLDELAAAGADHADAVDGRIAQIEHGAVATLVYTSGTTGRPKGCVVTHGNLIWEVRQVVSEVDDLFTPSGSTLMFLPLAHILARVVQVACVTRGVKIGYSSGIAQLVPELSLFRPTWVFAVPRVFEKVFNTAQGKAGTGLQRKLFDRAVATAVEYSRQVTAGGEVRRVTRVEHALYDRLVYAKLRRAFGGQLAFAISGGAPLGERLGHFFHGAGVLVLEGYGLTETTAAATLNTPEHFRIGTVGRPIPGAGVRIADDGEIHLHGGMVFAGYWNNQEATDEVLLDDGWFATGDVGEIDDDGYVRITGRKKELIVTAAGKNVAPAVLEDAVRGHPLVSQVIVIGDQRPFIAAMVTLDVEELAKWAEARGAQASAPGELTRELLEDEHQALRDEVAVAVDAANAQVSRAESIREFRILGRDFSIESGELTPTMKLKRGVVLERYRDVVSSIYGD
jgi:long-chain acyl-CoA synthetase